jgi:hypothetical protein
MGLAGPTRGETDPAAPEGLSPLLDQRPSGRDRKGLRGAGWTGPRRRTDRDLDQVVAARSRAGDPDTVIAVIADQPQA